FPRASGNIAEGQPTPSVGLDLQPGELVRVKSHQEILRTLTAGSKNRGMSWDAEMVPYCGGTYRVLKRVTRILDEKTGKMQDMKNPCIILDTVVCQARYSGCRMFCPRSIYPYWREIWLERVGPNAGADNSDERVVSTPISVLAGPPAQAMPATRRLYRMSIIIRRDVDRPYGCHPFARHVLSRLSSDLYFPKVARFGYLTE